MSRGTCVGVGTAALAALILVQGAVRAGDEAPGRPLEKKRRVDAIRDLIGGGHLGVTLEDGQEPGAVIKDVQPDTPAAKAGLQAGDVVVRYQGERVEGAAALARMVRETPAGRRVEMDVSRNGSVQKLSATLEKRGGTRWAEGLREGLREGGLEDFDIELPALPPMPDMPAVPPIPPVARDFEKGDFRRLLRETGGARKLGIQYQEVSGQLARYFKLDEDAGILVSEVDADGPAAKAGLKAGDVILKFNGSAVTDSRTFREQVRKAEPGSDAALTVSREGRSLDLTVKLGGTAPARRPGRTT